MNGLAADGMDKVDALGVQIESVGLASVQTVAKYGMAQSVGMSSVYSQLMGSARKWKEMYAQMSVGLSYDLVVGDCFLAMFPTDHLTRAVGV